MRRHVRSQQPLLVEVICVAAAAAGMVGRGEEVVEAHGSRHYGRQIVQAIKHGRAVAVDKSVHEVLRYPSFDDLERMVLLVVKVATNF